MKRFALIAALIALPGVAAASDIARPSATQYISQNWGGLYAGLQAGYARGNLSTVDTTGGVAPGPYDWRTNGGMIGGQAGYNWQLSNFVIGVEGDLAYLGNSGSGYIPSSNPAAHQDLTLQNGMLADITGRAGYSLGSVLVYGKGGAAWYTGGAGQTTTNPGYATTRTGTWSGYTYGGGVEYSPWANWSIKAEYLHYDFGTGNGYQTSISDPPIGYIYRNATNLTFDTVKIGVNRKFSF